MLTVEPASAGARLDRWLSERLTDLSRARLQSLIRGGLVRVDGAASKAAHRLRGGERVEIEVPPPADETLTPESVPLSIVYEDPHVLVVDKPAGMVVHPGAGRSGGRSRRRFSRTRRPPPVSEDRGVPVSSTGSTRTRRGCSSWPRPRRPTTIWWSSWPPAR